jgi:hypothetical protein
MFSWAGIFMMIMISFKTYDIAFHSPQAKKNYDIKFIYKKKSNTMGYFPTTRAGFVAWMKNLIIKLPAETAKMNEPVAETATVVTDLQALLNAYDVAQLATANARAAVASMLAAEKSISKKTKSFIQRLKANPLCTDEAQTILLIAGTRVQKDMTGYTPKITAVQTGSRIRISFKKRQAHALNIYGRLAGETNFTLLATVTRSPYFDIRLLAKDGITEMREYYAMAVQNNEEVGKPSAIVAVAFRG